MVVNLFGFSIILETPMHVPPIQAHLLDTPQAAKFLGVESHTLEEWRSTKRYRLPYVKIGRLVKYRLQDLQHFIECNIQLPQ